jgi:hypothetical protein
MFKKLSINFPGPFLEYDMLADTPPLSILKVSALLFLQEEPTFGSKHVYISNTTEG